MPDGGGNMVPKQQHQFNVAKAMESMNRVIAPDDAMRSFYLGMCMDPEFRPDEINDMLKKAERAMAGPNALAKAMRRKPRSSPQDVIESLAKSGEITKANLDVGTLTNFASITGGQSLGYVSLDTQMARGTTRPNSFTLYQCLHKSAAFQVVDYWSYAYGTGGGLPGTAFQGYGNVSSGTLQTSAGQYELLNITLKLAVNGRAITTALAAQNSFVDISAQENINAALVVLETINWTCYWGNPAIWSNQFQGIAGLIPTANVFDYNTFAASFSGVNGWSQAQTTFNLIYEAAALITSYKQYGRITHAFMSPLVAGSLQTLTTTILNNILTVMSPAQERLTGIVVDGDLQGMRTRFGEIQFPIDLYINARDKPAQAILDDNGVNAATLTLLKPTSAVLAAVTGTVAGSAWNGAFIGGSGIYSYAVASTDAAMNESLLTYGITVSGVAANGAYSVTITPADALSTAFRVYRSGLGYNPVTSGAANPASYRYIGTIAANAGNAVVFTDLNTQVPGCETVFLLDMDENDQALDFRYLLPLTKVELFAQNLFMPWAVCMIGSVRLKVPKFHGMIKNVPLDNPVFSPLAANTNAT